MEGLMLLGVNVAIIVISVWAILLENAPPERVKEALDAPPRKQRSRFAQFSTKARAQPPSARGR